MRIVHYGHACVLVETKSARLLFDPGTFSTGFEDLRDLDAILVTHQHVDHLDTDRLPALVAANPAATLIAESASAGDLDTLGLPVRTIAPGDALTVAGAELTVVGGEHAAIHQDFPVPPNVGYLVDHGAFYHPGDALFVPEQRIDVLGLPTSAPWLKLGEAIDFLRAVSPRVAVPIHQGLFNEIGLNLAYARYGDLAPAGCEIRVLTPREPSEL